MSRIDSWHWKISTGHYFQNGHHNIAKIQHCPISSQFDMWVDNDVPNWIPTLKNFKWSPFSKCITKIQHCPISSQFDMWVDNDVPNWFPTLNNFYWSPFSKWPPQYRKNSTLSDIIKFDMWVDNDVLNWFPTLKNFYWSPFSKWPPQYHTISTLSDFNVISYVGRLWCPELIPDIEKFLPVTIFKMATTISKKFNIVRYHQIWYVGR